MTGRVPSACSKRALHRAVEDVLFHVGSSWPRRRERRRAVAVVPPRLDVDGERLVVAAPHRDRRVVAEQVDGLARPGGPPACGRCGRSPTAAGSPARQHARARRRRRRARAGDVARGRAQVEAGVARPARRRARSSLGRGLAERHARRAEVGALEEQPLAVDRHDPVAHRHLAQPGAHGRAASLDARRRRRPSTVDVVQRLVAERPRPPQRRGCRRRSVHSTWLLARGERVLDARARRGRRPSCGRATVRGLVAVELGAQRRRCARSASASRHSTRRRPMRTGPAALDADRPPEAARVPRRVEAVPVLEHAGDGCASPSGRAGGAQVTSTASTCSVPRRARLGDLEGVREEVALGVAEVGAVEPDVALVEDAVEHDPVARARRRRPSSSKRVR